MRNRIVTAACVVAAIVGIVALFVTRPAPPVKNGDDQHKTPQRTAEYITSAKCKECHASEYDSWHDSYHRTMTQLATLDTVVAPIDDISLHSRGRDYRIYKKDDQFRVEMVDPDWEVQRLKKGLPIDDSANPPVIDRQIVMTTGSHHHQSFWIKGAYGNEFRQVPFIYHIATQQWIPREDSFLQMGTHEREFALWNDNCVICHTVGGRPGYSILNNTHETNFVELGIACEACHGPGGEHADYHRRMKSSGDATGKGDPTIINPKRLDKLRATAVCGQCHADFYPQKPDDWSKNGYMETFRPGELLDDSRVIVRFSELETLTDDREIDQGLEAGESAYWKDGTIRVGGREYNGLIESACFQKGEMRCLSCHSLHDYHEPNDQLSRKVDGNESCLQCHDEMRADITAHTHHAADSSGSSCLNCHMPYTTYALFKSIRSHRIDSPSSANFIPSGRPNACNLCHLDRTLKWTVDNLHEWYGQPKIEMDQERQQIAASLLWLLKGDAAQRTITVWSMGWKPALAASGDSWQTPFVAELLADPYAAIRFMSAQTLESLGTRLDDSFDFVGKESNWRAHRNQIIQSWKDSSTGQQLKGRSHLLFDSNGKLTRNEIDRLLKLRDNRRIVIAE